TRSASTPSAPPAPSSPNTPATTPVPQPSTEKPPDAGSSSATCRSVLLPCSARAAAWSPAETPPPNNHSARRATCSGRWATSRHLRKPRSCARAQLSPLRSRSAGEKVSPALLGCQLEGCGLGCFGGAKARLRSLSTQPLAADGDDQLGDARDERRCGDTDRRPRPRP